MVIGKVLKIDSLTFITLLWVPRHSLDEMAY